MNATNTKSDHRQLPRAKREPSPRDLAIYAARHSLGWTQEQLAEKYEVSQRRISAILKRVEAWRGNTRPEEQGELDPAARQRLERYLERERNQAIYDRAMRAFDAAPQVLKTTKKGERGGVTYSEEVTREQPANVQLLKAAQRASEALGKVADKPSPEKQPTPEEAEEWRRRDAKNWLYEQRFKAESHYRVPKSNDGSGAGFGDMDTVDMWLDALMGTQESNYFHESNPFPRKQLEQGRALAHLASYFQKAHDKREADRAATRAAAEAAALDAEHDGAVGNALRGVPDEGANCSDCSNSVADDLPQVDVAEAVTAESAAEKSANFSTAQGAVGNALRGVPDDAGAPTSDTPGAGLLPAKDKKKKKPSWQDELTIEAVQREFAHLRLDPETKDKFLRGILHQRKVAKLNEFRRRGLPIMMEFDPADGPVPPPYYQLDDYGWRG